MKSSAVPYWLALMVAIAGIYGAWKWWQVREAQTARSVVTYSKAAAPPLTEFELTERSGEPFRSNDMLGKVWVASFFFSTCPGTCTKLNMNIRSMQEDEDLADVHWVSITVDPGTDTLQVLRKYAEKFAIDPARWSFCRGDFDYVRRIGEDLFKLHVGYKGHTDHGIVVDRAGNIRGRLDINSRSERRQLRKLLLECLDEEAPSAENDS